MNLYDCKLNQTDSGFSLDSCQVIDTVSSEQAQKIKEVWGYE